jgi:hypothetical protein
MENLPPVFHQKAFLKKILYSGLNGGYPSTFSNGWALLGCKDEKDEKFLELVELFQEAKQKEILFTSLDNLNSRATQLQARGGLFSVLSLDSIKNVNIKVKKNETEKLEHRAGSRVLASSEQLLMYALAADFVKSGAIILAPDPNIESFNNLSLFTREVVLKIVCKVCPLFKIKSVNINPQKIMIVPNINYLIWNNLLVRLLSCNASPNIEKPPPSPPPPPRPITCITCDIFLPKNPTAYYCRTVKTLIEPCSCTIQVRKEASYYRRTT